MTRRCEYAEKLYNKLVWAYSTVSSPENDAILEQYKREYQLLLASLRAQGLGGVLINGIFRNLQE